MKCRWIAGMASLLFCFSVQAETPARSVIDACSKFETIGTASFVELDTTEQLIEEDESLPFKATYFKSGGRRFGYMEQRGKGTLVWQRKRVPLRNAIPLEDASQTPSTFSPSLASWAHIKNGRRQYLCVKFNFDGLGQSGSFQRVYGLYLMQLPSKTDALRLYFGVRQESQAN